MDESELFPGFGRPEDRRQEDGTPRSRKRAPRPKQAPGSKAAPGAKAAPDAKPDADPAAMPAKPAATPAPLARWITHEDLAAPTLSHLGECPALAETASAIAERCLAGSARFPHTLLVGPADSSKRLIAQAIAADMAAPFHVVELIHVKDPDALHAALRKVPAGAVVLMSGAEAFGGGALAELSRAVGAREHVRDTSLRDFVREFDREPWKRDERPRAARRYEDFTVIVTSRTHVPPDSPFHRWVQLQFFTQRNGQTERARMARALRRAGIPLEPAKLSEFASFAATYRIRTVQALNTLAAHLEAVRDDPAARDAVFEHAMDPTQVKRVRALLRRIAA
jgi:hypothetical protein